MTSRMPAVVPTLAPAPAAPPPAEWLPRLRAAFPALARTHAGHPVAYFDGPGGTQVPQAVADAVADYLLHHNANGGWAYPTSEGTDAIVRAGRAAMADLLGARPDEIAFGANMTTLAFHLARALGRRMPAGPAEGRALGPGDEIVVTELDHHANVAPWHALAVERGVTVRTVRLDPRTYRLDPDSLARAIGPRTRLVAVGAASNALGTITDVAEVAAMARRVGALTVVDAVHHAPHALVDVAATGAGFLLCSAYKFYGPHLGILWGRRDLIEGTDPPRLDPAPQTGPGRVQSGTPSFEAIHGTRAAVDFLADVVGDAPDASRRVRLARSYDALHAQAHALVERLWDGLAAVPGVALHGPPPGDGPRTPTVSFTVGARPARAVSVALARRGVFASHGDFYASTVVQRLGLAAQGLVRAGAACYTTADEVDRLVAGVREVAAER